ncbi:MAG: hypothetical protein P8K80_02560 [Phycisphaerales bacterium]|nr:hypothetical protein [Phycisphaerales bacterium]
MLATLVLSLCCQCPADVDQPLSTPGGYTGASVAMYGDLAVIGAPLGTGNDWATGVVLVYRNIDGTWTREAELTASDGLVGNMLGVSVDVFSTRIVAGAWFEDSAGTDAGCAYVFRYVDGAWTEEVKLTADDAAPYDYFGRTVGIDGDTVVVGAPLDDDLGESTGSVYVFGPTNDGWAQTQKLLAPDSLGSDQFGLGLDFHGDIMAIGSPFSAGGRGLVHVYRYGTSPKGYSHEQTLNDPDGNSEDYFGFEMAIDSQRLVVGSYRDDDAGLDAGRALSFDRIDGEWTLTQELLPVGTDVEGDSFGVSVAMHGERLLVGSRYGGLGAGEVTVFQLLDDNSWLLHSVIEPPDPVMEAEFGWAVAVNGQYALVGELEAEPDGMAWLYEGILESCDCPGDWNGDSAVNVDDLLLVIGGWGNPFGVDDLLEVIGAWGLCS